MKKLVSLVVLLALVLLVAPYGIGVMAEKRINHGLDELVEQAPYLTIAEKKYSRGWFHSEQDVSIDLFGSWARAMGKTPTASVNRASSDGFIHTAAEVETAAEAEPAPEAGGEAATPTPAEQQAKIAEALKGLRVTVHNDILHGPLLGLSGFGIARVNTHIVWPEEMRKKLTEAFGPDELVQIESRVAFLGGGSTTVSMDKRVVKEKGSEVSWDAMRMKLAYSKDGDHGTVDGTWPRFEVTEADSSHFVMNDMKMEFTLDRIVGDLFDTDGDFSIKSVNFVGKDKEAVGVKDVLYRFDTEKKGDFIDMILKVGTGPVTSKQLTLKEMHFDYSLRHVHVETLAKLLEALKKSYTAPMNTTADIEAAMFKPYKEEGVELLKYDPELAFDRVMIATPEGEGVIKGVIKFKGITAADFEGDAGAMAIIPKIDAVFDIDVSEDMLAKLSGNATAAGAAIDAGYATRKDGHLISHIEFKAGALTINGKPQAIPGMGGPPPPQ
jgi:uncharacterized protein YdgA (DUF945 family)